MKTHKGKVSDLGFGHLGNGMTVWDRTREVNHDYLKVAHISPERVVKYYAPVSATQRAAIESCAKNDDPSASVCQPEVRVFTTRPNKALIRFDLVDAVTHRVIDTVEMTSAYEAIQRYSKEGKVVVCAHCSPL